MGYEATVIMPLNVKRIFKSAGAKSVTRGAIAALSNQTNKLTGELIARMGIRDAETITLKKYQTFRNQIQLPNTDTANILRNTPTQNQIDVGLPGRLITLVRPSNVRHVLAHVHVTLGAAKLLANDIAYHVRACAKQAEDARVRDTYGELASREKRGKPKRKTVLFEHVNAAFGEKCGLLMFL